VRVELNPRALFKYGIGLEDVRAALASANANSPKGAIDVGGSATRSTPTTRRPRRRLPPLIVAYRNGAAVRLGRREVVDSVENLRNAGLANGKPAVLVIILFRQPGANIIDTVDGVKALLPQLQASIPATSTITVAIDRTDDHPRLAARRRAHAADRHRAGDAGGVPVPAQRARHADAQRRGAGVADRHLRRDVSAGLQPRQSVADGADIATGFVVDDAIVVLENISRHIEAGMPRCRPRCRARARSASPCCR
jgi:multidrug efflux pump